MRYVFSLSLLIGCSGSATQTPQPVSQPQTRPTQPQPIKSEPTSSIAATQAAPASMGASSAVDSEEAPLVTPVAEKLAKLPGASLPLKTFALSGPYKTYEDFCKASLFDINDWSKKAEADGERTGRYLGAGIATLEEDLSSVCPKRPMAKMSEEERIELMGYTFDLMKDEKLNEGPYQRIKFVHHQNMTFEMAGRGSIEMIIQTKEGWFATQIISYSPEWQGAGGAGGNVRDFKSFEITDAIPGGEKEIVFVLRSTDEKGGRIGSEGFKSKDLLFVCGLTSKGRPACYAPIRVSESEEDNVYNDETEELKKKTTRGWKLKEPYLKDGQLTLAPDGSEDEIPARIKALFGTHPLALP